jgi:hypothetical protein
MHINFTLYCRYDIGKQNYPTSTWYIQVQANRVPIMVPIPDEAAIEQHKRNSKMGQQRVV